MQGQMNTFDSDMSSIAGLVLAAGRGTRMKSHKTKVLHKVAGRPMMAWVLTALEEAGIRHKVLVVNREQYADPEFMSQIGQSSLCIQNSARGTADAVAAAANAFVGVKIPQYAQSQLSFGERVFAEYVLICAGDTPCLQGSSVKKFILESIGTDLSVLAMRLDEPYGYGRLLTQGSELYGIVEEKDCDSNQKKIDLVNTGIYLVKTDLLFSILDKVRPNNAQNEYYLTDIIKIAHEQSERKISVEWRLAGKASEYSGVNDRLQLAQAEKGILAKMMSDFMRAGVTIHLPESIFLDWSVKIGNDCEIGSGCVFLGQTKVGNQSKIGHRVILKDVMIGNNCTIGEGCSLEGLSIGDGEVIPSGTIQIKAKGV